MKQTNLKSIFIHFQTFQKEYYLDDTFLKRRRTQLKEIQTEQELESLIKDIEYQEGKNYALNILSRRSYSLYEMRSKLRQRINSEKTIAEIIQLLHRYEFIDDGREIKARIRAYQTKGMGPYLILQKLKQKVDPSLEEGVILEHYPLNEQLEVIEKLVAKRSSSQSHPAKLKRFLFQKGFSAEVIARFFDEAKMN